MTPTYIERFSVIGKKALVTGGSKGIGAVTAQILAEAGADVAIVGRDTQGLAETRSLVEATGRACLAIEADLATIDGPRQAGETALAEFGVIDILVNNAGVSYLYTLLDMPVNAWDEIMRVNLRAPFILAQTLAPKMIAQKRGKIINISSVAGVAALSEHSAYCASKGGSIC